MVLETPNFDSFFVLVHVDADIERRAIRKREKGTISSGAKKRRLRAALHTRMWSAALGSVCVCVGVCMSVCVCECVCARLCVSYVPEPVYVRVCE